MKDTLSILIRAEPNPITKKMKKSNKKVLITDKDSIGYSYYN